MLGASGREYGTCAFLRFLCFFLAVYHGGQLIGQDLFCLVQLASFPGIHLVDLLQRQEGQHTDTF